MLFIVSVSARMVTVDLETAAAGWWIFWEEIEPLSIFNKKEKFLWNIGTFACSL